MRAGAKCIAAVVCAILVAWPILSAQSPYGVPKERVDGIPGFGERPAAFFMDEPPFEPTQAYRDKVPPVHYVPKRPGHYSPAEWATAIDTTWGSGIPVEDKEARFRWYWNSVDDSYACWQGIDTTVWDSIRNLYWPDPPTSFDYSTVSKGRYAAILQQSSLVLLEAHQKFYDMDVASTALLPGVPLMHVGQHYTADHFGAGVTALPDSVAMVYKVAESHPMGLEPGDEILGYDGIPWPQLIEGLKAAELPIAGACPWGATEQTRTHRYVMGAGMNWHLFDTIDVRKYATGDTVHHATNLLEGENLELIASEQLDVHGVEIPYYSYLSWGVMDGTDIGYIYCFGWFGDSATVVNQWQAIVDSLEDVYAVSGIIIDVRHNYGANINFWDIPARFFSDTLDVFRLDERIPGGGHEDMQPATHPFWLQLARGVRGNAATYFDEPVAVLIGPNAESGGDLFPLTMSFRPHTKLFGLPTCGAFSGTMSGEWWPDFLGSMAVVNLKYLGDPERYMSHAVFPSDDFDWVDYEEVWLTPEGVAQGKDDVVEAAVAWIESLNVTDTDGDGRWDGADNCLAVGNPDQGITIAQTGDVTQDDVITSSDIIYLVNYVFKGGPDPKPCAASGDVESSGSVTASDIIYLVNHVFKGGAPPLDICQAFGLGWSCP